MRTRGCLTLLLAFAHFTTLNASATPSTHRTDLRSGDDGRLESSPALLHPGVNIFPTCDPRIPIAASSLFEKYQLDCPIVIPEGTEWFMEPLVTRFLKEYFDLYGRAQLSRFHPGVSKVSVRSVSRRFGQGVNVEFHEEGGGLPTRENVEASVRLRKELLTILSPLFRGGAHQPESFCCAHYMLFGNEELKPEFLDGSFVNFDRVWHRALTAIETVPDLRVNPASLQTRAGSRTIKTFTRSVPSGDPGFLVFEDVTVTMSQEDRHSVQLTILSDVCRRRRSSRNCVSLQLGGRADIKNRGSMNSYASEAPAGKAVMKALKK